MKKTLLLSLVSAKLVASCLEVGVTAGQHCSKSGMNIDTISKTTNSMQVSENGTTILTFPIYVATDSTDEVIMNIANLSSFINQYNDSISLSFEYVQKGRSITIESGKDFSLLPANSANRDGSSKAGDIVVKIASTLSSIQTAGDYTLSSLANVKLFGGGSVSNSFSIKGEVEQVSMVGFENLSSYHRGIEFKDSFIVFPALKFNIINELKKAIYVKNNTKNTFQIKFDTTPLVNQAHPNYKIALNYFYTEDGKSEQSIKSNKFFAITHGKKEGLKVGEMRFVTEKITGSLLAGRYKAVLNVTVSAK